MILELRAGSQLPWRSFTLARCPVRMAAKESVAKTDLIDDHDSKGQTDQPGNKSKAVRKALTAFSRKPECGCDAHGDQHHTGNCPDSKNQQISERPVSIADRSEDQQGHCRRTGKPVHSTNNKRPNRTIESGFSKETIQQEQRSAAKPVGVRFL